MRLRLCHATLKRRGGSTEVADQGTHRPEPRNDSGDAAGRPSYGSSEGAPRATLRLKRRDNLPTRWLERCDGPSDATAQGHARTRVTLRLERPSVSIGAEGSGDPTPRATIRLG